MKHSLTVLDMLVGNLPEETKEGQQEAAFRTLKHTKGTLRRFLCLQ